LLHEGQQQSDSLVFEKFSEFVKKVWNPRNFKGHVSPNELMFAIAKTSNGRFRPGADLLASQKSTDKKTATQNQLSTSLKSVDATSSTDPVQFLAWFFQTLNGDLKKQKVKLVESAFQGSLEMTQLSRPASTNPEQDGAAV